jgi:hypothetical protein
VASPEAPLEVRSIGAYLASQRELRGISIEELAAQTRIPLRSLQRMEAGVFDDEIDGFVRGFVHTVAAALGLDPEDAVARTLVEPDGSERRAVRSYLSIRRVLLAAGLVAGTAGAIAAFNALPLAGTPGRDAGDASERIVRRDPVRALAEAQGALASPAGPTLGELRPQP